MTAFGKRRGPLGLSLQHLGPSLTPGQGGGIPATAILLNTQPILLNGQYINLTKAA